MAVYTGTASNDFYTIARYGQSLIYDGKAGADTLGFDRLPSTYFKIYAPDAEGNIIVDSVAGASAYYHIQLKNVELLAFSNKTVNLKTLYPDAFVDTTAPTVKSFLPADNATNVSIDTTLVVTFSESVVLGTGNIVIKDGLGATVETFNVASSTQLAVSGSKLTIIPSAVLEFNSGYTVQFDAGSIKDASGNSFAGGSEYNFTTASNVIDGTAAANTINGSSLGDVENGLAGNDKLFGLAGDDTLNGGAGNDILDGGTGADSMTGGDGSDTYLVDDAGDLVVETSALVAGGKDTVKSTISYELTSNVESLVLMGTDSINGTGNELKNSITGNTANNLLDGAAGADKLSGGKGNDTYIVDLATKGIGAKSIAVLQDTVVEAAGAGNGSDTLELRGTVVLTKATNFVLAATLENLDATDTATTLLNLKGNAAANAVTGNAAANLLSGMAGQDTLAGAAGADTLSGGAGNDQLTGGADADIFLFDSPLNANTNLDTITDFVSGTDHIQLSKAVFARLKGDADLSDNLHIDGVGAQDANDFLIYNTATGILSYDKDGSGASAAVQFAKLGTDTHPDLLSSDIFVV